MKRGMGRPLLQKRMARLSRFDTSLSRGSAMQMFVRQPQDLPARLARTFREEKSVREWSNTARWLC